MAAMVTKHKVLHMASLMRQLQTQAEQEGRDCVVGALIMDSQGKIFAQKRSYTRHLFPGCWDIAGGHVEKGESLYDALIREIKEETGWIITEAPELVETFDWEIQSDQKVILKREFDFLFRVESELLEPILEKDKFIDYCWISKDNIEVLRESRKPNDDMIYEIIKNLLEHGSSN